MPSLVEDFVDVFAERGFAARLGFLRREHVCALARQCREAWAAGELEPGHVGRGAGRERLSDVRGDYVRWVQEAERSDAVTSTLALMERVRAAINRRLYLGLLDLECHFAVYPPGAVYERHVDVFRDESRRAVSWVLYLNDEWAESDGGALRIHTKPCSGGIITCPDDESRSSHDYFDVPPLGGTLVAFASRDYEHEVLASMRPRMSLTGWFRTRA